MARPLDGDAILAFAAHCVTPMRQQRPDTANGGHDGSPLLRSCVGIETEWFVVDPRAVHTLIAPERTREALAAGAGGDGSVLPGGSRITFEPGGQLELSGPPADLRTAIRSTAADLRLVRAALAERGLAIVGMGTDPLRAGVRQTVASRYAAMEEHFRTGGGRSGPAMMCSTASVQVNLDLGATVEDARRRFQLAHTVGPVLTAMFAASPALAGRRTGWRSTRQAIWTGIDASRTGSVLDLEPPAITAATHPESPDIHPQSTQSCDNPTFMGGLDIPRTHQSRDSATADLAELWARYLLDARLMMIAEPGDADVQARGEQHFTAATGGHTFADWLAGRGPASRPPTLDDLRYHATTVFPPVRPRGWWELRYLDAQPGDDWQVAVAVTTALLDDPTATAGAAEACAPVARRWPAASMQAMADEPLRRAALCCLELAAHALRRAQAAELADAVDQFAERHTLRGRCPADDLSERIALIGPAGLLREEAHSCVSVA